MKPGAIVFSITAAQLATLRACAKSADADLFKTARQDPRWSLCKKGLLENVGPRQFEPTAFGGAILVGLKNLKP